MPKVAVILSGCGHLDGAEIRESVITLLELDKAGAEVTIFAPDINQTDVMNHLTQQPMSETRNVLVEAARIARGEINNLSTLKVDDFDAVIIPGGFGVAKNLSDLATQGKDAIVNPDFKSVLQDFLAAKKPIGAICISPAVLVAALQDKANITVTIGDDKDGLIEALGGTHKICTTDNIIIDSQNNITSTVAYMQNDSLAKIAKGIEKLIHHVLASTA